MALHQQQNQINRDDKLLEHIFDASKNKEEEEELGNYRFLQTDARKQDLDLEEDPSKEFEKYMSKVIAVCAPNPRACCAARTCRGSCSRDRWSSSKPILTRNKICSRTISCGKDCRTPRSSTRSASASSSSAAK